MTLLFQGKEEFLTEICAMNYLKDMKKKEIYTIGHSTRAIDAFLDLLKIHDIKQVVDVRTIPKSRAYPQFNGDALKKSLKKAGITYHQLPKLGGLRHTTKASINMGWHNASFRGFADYMQTAEFWEGLEELKKLGHEARTAILCAEALPWRCHRSLIADALTLQKWKVFHIISKQPPKEHTLTPFLKVKKGVIFYPAES